MFSSELLRQLQNRLKVGNRRGVHLNAIPQRSRYKLDINHLRLVDEGFPEKFLETLLTQPKFKLKLNASTSRLKLLPEESKNQLNNTFKIINNIINQVEAIDSEKGINTFAFGFPIFARIDQKDGKLTVAPVALWSMKIKKLAELNAWELSREEDDPIQINEVLINHLMIDSKVEVSQIDQEVLEKGFISLQDIQNICLQILDAVKSPQIDLLDHFGTSGQLQIDPIYTREIFGAKYTNAYSSGIEISGIFSVFEIQKHSIIDEYDVLLKDSRFNVSDKSELIDFDVISGIPTDPTQQSVINQLNKPKNLIIQGPPGTGKSQSLSAILLNSLSSGQKTLVVCEKRTALEVLLSTLEHLGLDRYCLLIQDATKDRSSVVRKFRERDYKASDQKKSLDYQNEVEKILARISEVNDTLNELNKPFFAGKIFKEIVGRYLQLRRLTDDYKFELPKKDYDFSPEELSTFLKMLEEAELKFRAFNALGPLDPNLNSHFFIGENPYLLQRRFLETLLQYQSELQAVTEIKADLTNRIVLYVKNIIQQKYDYYLSSISDSRGIIRRNSAVIDEFANVPKHRFKFRFLSIFSRKYKQIEKDYFDLIDQFREIVSVNQEDERFWFEQPWSFEIPY